MLAEVKKNPKANFGCTIQCEAEDIKALQSVSGPHIKSLVVECDFQHGHCSEAQAVDQAIALNLSHRTDQATAPLWIHISHMQEENRKIPTSALVQSSPPLTTTTTPAPPAVQNVFSKSFLFYVYDHHVKLQIYIFIFLQFVSQHVTQISREIKMFTQEQKPLFFSNSFKEYRAKHGFSTAKRSQPPLDTILELIKPPGISRRYGARRSFKHNYFSNSLLSISSPSLT